MMNTDLFFSNGLDATTGDYLLPRELTPQQVTQVARGQQWEPNHLEDLKRRIALTREYHYGVAEGIDPLNLAQTGWGIIFAQGDENTEAIKEALKPLLDRRRSQAAAGSSHYYKEYVAEAGLLPKETKQQFLARQGAGPGPADPESVPYYLLLIGPPDRIPFRFQYQLDVQYAVGRLHFDTLEEYARYAKGVVEVETGSVASSTQAAFFGPRNTCDPATTLSSDHLVKPLAAELTTKFPNWQFTMALDEDGTKKRLSQLLSGPEPPALLFTASHGMAFPKGHPLQLDHQGALLCQDWPGVGEWHKAIPPDHYFSADDIGPHSRLQGLISFHFACFGAGTPRMDDFVRYSVGGARELAPQDFLARLPQKMLAHPAGGVLAVIGHVERAWGYSFIWPAAARQLQTLATFSSTLRRLLNGYTVGAAMEYFNERYAELSTDLSSTLHEIDDGAVVDDLELSRLWTSNNDARSYIVLGDPAVRLVRGNSG